MLTLPPLSLYVHIPWCVRKCPYCDFNSHKAGETLPEPEYVTTLLQDLQQSLPWVQGRPLHSIFFGGGTPSLFSAASIGRILDAAEALIGFESGIEITMEANPGTFEQNKFLGFRQAGVNRLSIGAQSFNDRHLQLLGRIHDGSEATRAVEMARRAGFDNLNLDLMHGLPEQSAAEAVADLRQAIDLAPEHISWYQLTIEPNTEFYRRPPTLPVEDALADIQDEGEALLAAEGFIQYEVSAYARGGRRSQHNLNYWRFGDYLGIGAGAHGKVTQLDARSVLRTRKTRMPQHYLQNCAAVMSEVPEEERALEFMMNVLRLRDGVERSLFGERTGRPWSDVEAKYQALVKQGLLDEAHDTIRVTELGLRYLNGVLSAFMDND